VEIQAVTQTSSDLSQSYNTREGLLSFLQEFLPSQRFAVLATHKDGQPYTHLVAFVATKDMKDLIFVTPRATRKFANMMTDPRVALMIDNRKNKSADINDATAVSAMGIAEEVSGADKETLLPLYISKHPYLEAFAKASSCALVRISVETYDVAWKFQNVTELKMIP
jgi:nitroimidazol reductase NimA-like FMN-containing flavoprotein (pyridoxamine 5'-phosphate oxidase superfamily)